MLLTEKDSAGWSVENGPGAGEEAGHGVPPSRGEHKAPFPPRWWDRKTDRQTGTFCVVSWDGDSEATQ